MINEIVKSLSELRQNLSYMENHYDIKFKQTEKRKLKFENCDRRIEKLLNYQNENFITINAGGEVFILKKNIFIGSKYNNKIEKLLTLNDNNYDDDTEIFLEINSFYFLRILEIVRKSLDEYILECNFSDQEKELYLNKERKFRINTNENSESLCNYINYFFEDDAVEVMRDFIIE